MKQKQTILPRKRLKSSKKPTNFTLLQQTQTNLFNLFDSVIQKSRTINIVKQKNIQVPHREDNKAPLVFVKPSKNDIINPFSVMFATGALIVIIVTIGIFYYITQETIFPASTIYLPDNEIGSTQILSYLTPENLNSEDTIDPDTMPPIPISLNVREYTVRSGDSLSRIAQNAGVSQDAIISMNSQTNLRALKIGMKLKLPNINGIAYVVRKGDSISGIASSYKVSVNTILDANNLESKTLISGQRLFIPGAKLSEYDRNRALGKLFVWPASGTITSWCGYRIGPTSGLREYHNGIDIKMNIGTSIKSVMNGKIAAIDYSPLYGNYIIVQHPDGFQSMYAHLSKAIVSVNQSVVQGQKIAESGNTGNTTGAHLHFSLFKNGTVLNPLKYLSY